MRQSGARPLKLGGGGHSCAVHVCLDALDRARYNETAKHHSRTKRSSGIVCREQHGVLGTLRHCKSARHTHPVEQLASSAPLHAGCHDVMCCIVLTSLLTGTRLQRPAHSSRRSGTTPLAPSTRFRAQLRSVETCGSLPSTTWKRWGMEQVGMEKGRGGIKSRNTVCRGARNFLH